MRLHLAELFLRRLERRRSRGTRAKTAALICATVPGASSSFILARQLGGNAQLMANITTAQTLAPMVTMPLILWVFA